MSHLIISAYDMAVLFSVHNITMLQQDHLWRHNGAHTGLCLATSKQLGWCQQNSNNQWPLLLTWFNFNPSMDK